MTGCMEYSAMLEQNTLAWLIKCTLASLIKFTLASLVKFTLASLVKCTLASLAPNARDASSQKPLLDVSGKDQPQYFGHRAPSMA